MTLNLSIGIEHKLVNPAKMKSILKQLRNFSCTSNSSIEVLKPKKPQRQYSLLPKKLGVYHSEDDEDDSRVGGWWQLSVSTTLDWYRSTEILNLQSTYTSFAILNLQILTTLVLLFFVLVKVKVKKPAMLVKEEQIKFQVEIVNISCGYLIFLL